MAVGPCRWRSGARGCSVMVRLCLEVARVFCSHLHSPRPPEAVVPLSSAVSIQSDSMDLLLSWLTSAVCGMRWGILVAMWCAQRNVPPPPSPSLLVPHIQCCLPLVVSKMGRLEGAQRCNTCSQNCVRCSVVEYGTLPGCPRALCCVVRCDLCVIGCPSNVGGCGWEGGGAV